jgi:pilus assembly protein Flp/PilA
MSRLSRFVAGLLISEKAATAVEYGIMVAAIAAVIVATVVGIGGEVKDSLFSKIDTLLDSLP